MRSLPNIILIVMDTARAKSFSTYGHSRPTTPEIDRIAEKAVVYRNCFSPAPWTVPSHVSLFTGVYPYEHGANSFLTPFLPEEYISLPQCLRLAAYRTYAISSNKLVSAATGFSRGFDVFIDPYSLFPDPETAAVEKFLAGKSKVHQAMDLFVRMRQIGEIAPSFRAVANYLASSYLDPLIGMAAGFTHFRKIYRGNRYLIDTTPLTRRTLALSRRIFRRASGEKDRPFFLFINFLQNHTVYNPPARYRNRFVRRDIRREKSLFPVQLRPRIGFYGGERRMTEDDFAYLQGLYEEELSYLDSVIGTLYRELETLGLAEDTLFILTSDHGEHIGEKGHFTHFFSLYNELLHVPLIVKYPKGILAPGVEERLVQTHDLFATILEIIGSRMPAPISSKSFLDTARREYALSQFYYDREFYFKADFEMQPGEATRFDAKTFPYGRSLVSVISADLWKLIARSDGDEELYHLARDFNEGEDLSRNARHDPIRGKLRSEIEACPGLKQWLN